MRTIVRLLARLAVLGVAAGALFFVLDRARPAHAIDPPIGGDTIPELPAADLPAPAPPPAPSLSPPPAVPLPAVPAPAVPALPALPAVPAVPDGLVPAITAPAPTPPEGAPDAPAQDHPSRRPPPGRPVRLGPGGGAARAPGAPRRSTTAARAAGCRRRDPVRTGAGGRPGSRADGRRARAGSIPCRGVRHGMDDPCVRPRPRARARPTATATVTLPLVPRWRNLTHQPCRLGGVPPIRHRRRHLARRAARRCALVRVDPVARPRAPA